MIRHPINNFMKYVNKQYELVKFMKNNGFNTIAAFGAPQYFISIVSKRDTDPTHITALDKLSFVEEYIKNHLKEAKKEYLEAIKIVEYRKKNRTKHKEKIKLQKQKQALKKEIHTCDCKYCSHKQRKRSHHCHCEYCVVNKKVLNENDDKTDTNQDTNQDTKIINDTDNNQDTKIINDLDTNKDTKTIINTNTITDTNQDTNTINETIINRNINSFINIDKNIIILILIISLVFNAIFSIKIFY